jgi:CubicO group peptidase (beta-lactamase class C family)
MVDLSELCARLDGVLEAEDGFSGVVHIRHRGKVVYTRAAGYADRSNELPNRVTTRFGIASGTKFFTALAIGRLIEAGTLDFSTRLVDITRLADCVPVDFDYDPAVTIRHLLTHTSGVPDYYDEEVETDVDTFSVGVPWYDLQGPRDYLAVFPEAPMKFAPGERFSYSNGGYILLGVVIEALSGMPYRDFVAQEVFAPAGMDRSGYFAMNQLPAETAWGYVEEAGGGWHTNIYNLPVIGAADGGAFTTAGDLCKLWDAFWAGEIIPEAMVEVFAAPYVRAESEGPGLWYGHGLWLWRGEEGAQAGAPDEVYITGYDAGVSFHSCVRRDHDLVISVLANTSGGAWPVVRAVNEVLH